MSSNQKTLDTYQQNFDRYIDGTVKETRADDFVGQWLLAFLSRIPKDGKILEIGSAFGRDASFISKQGFENLEVTDAFDAAVGYLNEHNFSARKLNIVDDELVGMYDGILANAVFLHLSEADFSAVLKKCQKHLVETGRLAFSLKKGDGEEWSNVKMDAPRYFHYWQPDEIRSMLSNANLAIVNESITPDEKWLHYIVEKAV